MRRILSSIMPSLHVGQRKSIPTAPASFICPGAFFSGAIGYFYKCYAQLFGDTATSTILQEMNDTTSRTSRNGYRFCKIKREALLFLFFKLGVLHILFYPTRQLRRKCSGNLKQKKRKRNNNNNYDTIFFHTLFY